MDRAQRDDSLRDAMRREFCDLYPTTSNEALKERFGVSRGTIQRWAQELDVKKDLSYRREVQRKNAIGRVQSAETRAKIAAARQGRSWTQEQRVKTLQTRRERSVNRGERHYKWKGGRPWERFKSPKYLAWRNAVLERDGYVCQQCGRQCKKRERGLAAHHIKPYAEYPAFRYEVSNGITLCRQCHMTLHGKAPAIKEPIPCACGCGIFIDLVDAYGRVRRYVNHYGRRGQRQPESAKLLLREQRKGKALTPGHRARIAESLRNSTKRLGRPPKSSK
jgi:5-methylcytosine-specific restriction endonuclease McrA